MKLKHLAILFALLWGAGAPSFAQRIESNVTRVPANAETLLSVKAANFRDGWTVSVDASEKRTGPTVFALRNSTGMVTLHVQTAPRPDGTIGFSTSIPVEIRKFQETVVVLKGIGAAPAAAAAPAVTAQGPDSLMGSLRNSCKSHEVKFEFLFNGQEYKSWTVSPGKRRSGVEIPRGTYKVRMYTRPYETNSAAGRAFLHCEEEADAARAKGGNDYYHRTVVEPSIARKQDACEARASKMMKTEGAHGKFRHRDSEEAFAVTEDKWRLSHDCKHDN